MVASSLSTPKNILAFKRVLTLDELCEYTGYARSYVYKLTHAGVIPFSKPNGKSLFFDREKIDAFLLSNPSKSEMEKECEAATYVINKPVGKLA